VVAPSAPGKFIPLQHLNPSQPQLP
jgi:hypothetical protein